MSVARRFTATTDCSNHTDGLDLLKKKARHLFWMPRLLFGCSHRVLEETVLSFQACA